MEQNDSNVVSFPGESVGSLRSANSDLISQNSSLLELNRYLQELIQIFTSEVATLFARLESENTLHLLNLDTLSPYLLTWWQEHKSEQEKNALLVAQIQKSLKDVPDTVLAQAGLQRIAP